MMTRSGRRRGPLDAALARELRRLERGLRALLHDYARAVIQHELAQAWQKAPLPPGAPRRRSTTPPQAVPWRNAEAMWTTAMAMRRDRDTATTGRPADKAVAAPPSLSVIGPEPANDQRADPAMDR